MLAMMEGFRFRLLEIIPVVLLSILLNLAGADAAAALKFRLSYPARIYTNAQLAQLTSSLEGGSPNQVSVTSGANEQFISSFFVSMDTLGVQAGGSVVVRGDAQALTAVASSAQRFLGSNFVLLVGMVSTAVATATLTDPNEDQKACFVPTIVRQLISLNTTAEGNHGGKVGLPATELDPPVTFVLPADGSYRLLFALCKQGHSGSYVTHNTPHTALLDVSFQYELVNSAGVRATLEDIPLINVFMSLSIVYLTFLLLGIVWLLNRRYRQKKAILRIHSLLFVSLVLKLIDAALLTTEQSVLRVTNDDSPAMEYTRKAVSVIADMIFLGAQLLLCRGYSFVYPKLNGKDKQLLFVCLVFYGITRVAFELGSSDNTNLAEAYRYSYTMGRFIITIVSMISLALTVEAVRKAMILEDVEGNMQMYLRFSTFVRPFAVYAVIPILVLLLTNTIISWRNKYLEALLTELTTAYYFLIVMYHFRGETVF